jgi:hypothetical protein
MYLVSSQVNVKVQQKIDGSGTEINGFGFAMDEVQLECQRANKSQMLWSTL